MKWNDGGDLPSKCSLSLILHLVVFAYFFRYEKMAQSPEAELHTVTHSCNLSRVCLFVAMIFVAYMVTRS